MNVMIVWTADIEAEIEGILDSEQSIAVMAGMMRIARMISLKCATSREVLSMDYVLCMLSESRSDNVDGVSESLK